MGFDEFVQASHGEGGSAGAEDVAETTLLARVDREEGGSVTFVDIMAGVSDKGLVMPAIDATADESSATDKVFVDTVKPCLVYNAGVLVLNRGLVAGGIIDELCDFCDGLVAEVERASKVDLELQEGESRDLMDAANIEEGEAGLAIRGERCRGREGGEEGDRAKEKDVTGAESKGEGKKKKEREEGDGSGIRMLGGHGCG